MKRYFYSIDGSPEVGPINYKDLVRLQKAGKLYAFSRIRTEGATEWSPLQTVISEARERQRPEDSTSCSSTPEPGRVVRHTSATRPSQQTASALSDGRRRRYISIAVNTLWLLLAAVGAVLGIIAIEQRGFPDMAQVYVLVVCLGMPASVLAKLNPGFVLVAPFVLHFTTATSLARHHLLHAGEPLLSFNGLCVVWLGSLTLTVLSYGIAYAVVSAVVGIWRACPKSGRF